MPFVCTFVNSTSSVCTERRVCDVCATESTVTCSDHFPVCDHSLRTLNTFIDTKLLEILSALLRAVCSFQRSSAIFRSHARGVIRLFLQNHPPSSLGHSVTSPWFSAQTRLRSSASSRRRAHCLTRGEEGGDTYTFNTQ